MKRKRVIACVLASAFVLSQLTSVSYAAEDVNGKVQVDMEGASVKNEDGTRDEITGGETGSVTNTSGGAAVAVTTDTDGGNIESISFTVDGNVTSNDTTMQTGGAGVGNEYIDNTVTGIQTNEHAYGGAVAETTLNVTGDVNVEATQEKNYEAQGISVRQTDSIDIDKSVTVNTGNVTVEHSANGRAEGIGISNNPGNFSSDEKNGENVHSAVNVNVDGNVTAKGCSATGITAFNAPDGSAETEINITGDVKVSSVPENGDQGIAIGVDYGTHTTNNGPTDINLTINIGGNIDVQGDEALGVGSSGAYIPSKTGTVRVGGDVTVAATKEDGTAAAIMLSSADWDANILVGGNAVASGGDSAGIALNYLGGMGSYTDYPSRIEVLGTVGGDTGDIVLSLDDEKYVDEQQHYEAIPTETVKADLEAQLPTIVTHKLENNSIVIQAKTKNKETEKAAAEILADKILYTVNYTAKVSNENGQEDSSLGTIEITKFDGLQLDQEKLQTTGETVYVAKAGEVIKINIKATDKTTTENKKLVENNKTTTWTETTSYEIDLDKLDGNVSGGKGYVLKAEKKENGEVIYTLEVKQGGGVDIDVNSIIRAIVTKSNEKTVTNDSSDGSDSSDSSGSGSSGSGDSGSGSVNYTPSTTYYIGSGGGSWQYVGSYHDPSGYPGSDYSYADDEYQSAAEVEGVWGYDPNQGYYQSQSSGGSWQSVNGSNSGNDSNSGNANKAGRTWWRWKDNDQYGAAKKAGWKKLLWGDRLNWYFFDKDSYMRAGFVNWDGNRYFLNPISDGYRGRMLTGYQKINGNDYYFEEKEGPFQGRMYRNEGVPDGRIAGPDGVIR